MAGGAAKAGSASSGKTPVIQTGWKRLDGWIAAIAAAVDANHKECVTRSFTDRGKASSAEPGGVAGGAGGGGGTTETVTGAVNGVPATLNVMTDGAGWTEIP
jgi:hypothetical protein